MIGGQILFDYALAAIIISFVISFTVLVVVGIKARDSRTSLAVEIGELRSKMHWYNEQQQSQRYRIDAIEKKLEQ